MREYIQLPTEGSYSNSGGNTAIKNNYNISNDNSLVSVNDPNFRFPATKVESIDGEVAISDDNTNTVLTEGIYETDVIGFAKDQNDNIIIVTNSGYSDFILTIPNGCQVDNLFKIKIPLASSEVTIIDMQVGEWIQYLLFTTAYLDSNGDQLSALENQGGDIEIKLYDTSGTLIQTLGPKSIQNVVEAYFNIEDKPLIENGSHCRIQMKFSRKSEDAEYLVIGWMQFKSKSRDRGVLDLDAATLIFRGDLEAEDYHSIMMFRFTEVNKALSVTGSDTLALSTFDYLYKNQWIAEITSYRSISISGEITKKRLVFTLRNRETNLYLGASSGNPALVDSRDSASEFVLVAHDSDFITDSLYNISQQKFLRAYNGALSYVASKTQYTSLTNYASNPYKTHIWVRSDGTYQWRTIGGVTDWFKL